MNYGILEDRRRRRGGGHGKYLKSWRGNDWKLLKSDETNERLECKHLGQWTNTKEGGLKNTTTKTHNQAVKK